MFLNDNYHRHDMYHKLNNSDHKLCVFNSLRKVFLGVASALCMAGCAPYITPEDPSISSPPMSSPDFRPGQPQTAGSSNNPQTVREPLSQTPSPVRSNATDKRKQAVAVIYDQALTAFNRQEWEQAIQLSERGLRMQRQYAPFYWLLAESYHAKGNQQQAQSFARQGMNYAQKESTLHKRLSRLSKRF